VGVERPQPGGLLLGAQGVELAELLGHGVVSHESLLDVLWRRHHSRLGVMRLGCGVGRLRILELLDGEGEGGHLVCVGGDRGT